MSFIEKPREENNPYLQLLMIVFYIVIGLSICLLLSALILFAVYGMQLINNPAIVTVDEIKYKPVLQVLLSIQSIGVFLAPALLLPIVEKRRLKDFYGLELAKVYLLALVFLLMMVSMPIMEWVTVANQKMVLPDFLKGIEAWMRSKEDELMRTTYLLLRMNGTVDFLITLLVLAVIPAVCEEFFFRAVLQRTLGRIFKNIHVAIWVSAFVFSAIHLQFYGFLPRFLLGAGFGYLYWYTNSLWYNVFAHFLNNAYAVCMAFYMQKHNMSITEMDKTPQFAWYGYLISLVLTTAAFLIFKKQTSNKKIIS